MKKICFIAQFPPPIHGLSKAVDTLYNSELNKTFEFEKINITDNKRILSNLIAIRKSKADLFYFTISQTKGGNLRDLAIFSAIGKRKCLVHLHGGYYRTMLEKLPLLQKKANYYVMRKIYGAIVLGPSLRWIFEGIVPDERIFTVPNCIDNEFLISDEEFLEKINGLSNRKTKNVLFLSNFIREKGYREVLKMALLEKNSGTEKKFHFHFAGHFFDEKEKEYFWNYVKDNKLDDYVTYHGVVKGKAKKNLLYISDVFCLLTTYANEGQPISILEAMGNGMLVVTTNHAGISDLVTDKLNGIVIDKRSIDVQEIYNRLVSFSNYSEIGIVNRETVKKRFCQQNYINNMKKCFL